MKITIGLPVYNAEKYIKECIISILNQSFSDFELLVVDDGSTDRSISLVKEFKDDRIKLIVDGKNLGLPARLNQIAQLCETEYLARMDADDIMHQDRIAQQLHILEKNPDIDVLGSNCYTIDATNQITGTRHKYHGEDTLRNAVGFVHPSIVAKTTWFLNNPYNVKIRRSQDAELWARTRDTSVFKVFTKPLLFYREFGGTYYKKYWTNLRSKGVILGEFVRNVEFVKAVKYFLFTYLKAVLVTVSYTILAAFNMEKLLINLRSTELDMQQKKRANQYLADVLQFNE